MENINRKKIGALYAELAKIDSQFAPFESISYYLKIFFVSMIFISIIGLISSKFLASYEARNANQNYQQIPINEATIDNLQTFLSNENNKIDSVFIDILMDEIKSQVQLNITTRRQLLDLLKNRINELKEFATDVSGFFQANKQPFSTRVHLEEKKLDELADKNAKLVPYAKSVINFWSSNNDQHSLLKEKQVRIDMDSLLVKRH